MRLLVVIAHYFKISDEAVSLGSGSSALPRVAALNATIVALHRYFGPHRSSLNVVDPQGRSSANSNILDIVIVAKRGENILEHIGIDQRAFSVEYCECDPLFLPYEAQRVMRERVGHYDMYAFMEDDLIVDDPSFFAKIAWFAEQFGPQAVLFPIRYELSSTGMPEKISVSVHLSENNRAPFRNITSTSPLKGIWNGVEQTFVLPNNPHAGCYVVTDLQLSKWIASPTFYDRDASWVSPLESGATLSISKQFSIYMPSVPDPWFLQIEHYGVRLSATKGGNGCVRGGPLLLALLESRVEASNETLASIDRSVSDAALRVTTEARLREELLSQREELKKLRNSRSRLLKALCLALWNKGR